MSTPARIARRLLAAFLPDPDNTIAQNIAKWTHYDWSQRGEEWSNPTHPLWKESLIKHVLEPYIPPASRVLELGPGAGRWTETLIRRASHVTAIDVSDKCLALCRERFRDASNIDFYLNDGRSLGSLASDSVTRIWSFDVFVHVLKRDIQAYLHEFARVLAPGGLAVIHHGRIARRDIGWRSDMTADAAHAMASRARLRVVTQFNSWDNGRYHLWPDLPLERDPDIITVFERPLANPPSAHE